MDADQWIMLATQAGIGGVAMVVIVKVIVPMFLAESAKTVKALSTNVEATDRNTLAVSTLAERVARLEGIFDHSDRAPLPEATPHHVRTLTPPAFGPLPPLPKKTT